MPWTAKQVAYFHAVASGAVKDPGLSREKAAEMAAEGVKGEGQREALSVMRRKGKD